MIRIYDNRRTILLHLCLIALLFPLFACAQNGYAEEIARSEESVRIAKYPDNVRRVGDTLYLKLASGAEVIFKDQSECETYNTCGDSYFEEYLFDLDLYILDFHLYEGGHHLVISGKSGTRYSMHAYPKVSPDRLRLVAASASEEDGESGISLWRVEGGKLLEEFYYNANDVGYYNLSSFVKWEGNNTVIIAKFLHSKDTTVCTEPGFVEAQIALRKIGGSWKLDKEFIEGTVSCTPY
jgi:hypothetical protein